MQSQIDQILIKYGQWLVKCDQRLIKCDQRLIKWRQEWSSLRWISSAKSCTPASKDLSLCADGSSPNYLLTDLIILSYLELTECRFQMRLQARSKQISCHLLKSNLSAGANWPVISQPASEQSDRKRLMGVVAIWTHIWIENIKKTFGHTYELKI